MKFTAVITGTTTSGTPVPDADVEALGAGKRPKVVVTVAETRLRRIDKALAELSGR